jgi:large subunit ribosomal protein L9
MKVIFKDTDQVKDVPDGYARNYLIPKGLVVIATSDELQKIDEKNKKMSEEEERKRSELILAAKKVDGKEVTVSEKSGEGGKLFGSVTSKEISEAVNFQQNLRIDKHNIELVETIKSIGRYEIKLNFGMGISAKIILNVKEA